MLLNGPIPVNGTNILLKNPQPCNLSVDGNIGDIVFTGKIHCGGDCSDYLLNINKQLVPGVYLMRLKTNGVRNTQRLFVK